MMCNLRRALLLAAAASVTHAQTFQRLGGCPTFGCVFPPDQVDFLAGQYFDVRLEVHAPINGSEANGKTVPDDKFTFTIAKDGQAALPAASYFKVAEPMIERWNFSWYEDLFAQDAYKPSFVNVTAKAYRKVALYEPGTYTALLTYNNGTTTKAEWTVRPAQTQRKAKNVILFIGDGMTTNQITAARLIGHKMVNGKYQSKMMIDSFPALGHQMTHSLDSYITDSANSATALYSGHKSTVNALGCYKDSSPNKFDDPKMESIAEMFYRLTAGGVGIVSTAFIADATPAALTAHTPDRSQYGAVIDSFLNGITNYTWTNWNGPDVLFGGGAEQFYTNYTSGVTKSNTYQGKNYYNEFAKKGYTVVMNNTALGAASNSSKTLGIFTTSNLDVWLDRNVYKSNLLGHKNTPDGQGGNATDQPGLKDMTRKAIDILQNRHGKDGWFLMSEAASIDKQMHRLDYDRALGDLLELDDTVRSTVEHLKAIGELENTLILVTADHGHGFDVMGGVDTKYLNAQKDDRSKRRAVGTYYNSGQSQYTFFSENGPNSAPDARNNTNNPKNGSYFPLNWDPRYTLFSGIGADPDRRENYQVHKNGARTPAVNITGFPDEDFFVNPVDAVSGFVLNGTLSTDNSQGVHSLTDVPVYAMGPCQSTFSGTYGNVDIFFNIANCLGLARTSNTSAVTPYSPSSSSLSSSAAAASVVTITKTVTAGIPGYGPSNHPTGNPLSAYSAWSSRGW